MECEEPALSDEVAKVATPEVLRVPVPSVVVPSLKVTVPVGVPEPPLVTVAVNVMDWPKAAGFGDDVNVTVEALGLTVWPPESVPELLLKLPSALT